MQWRSQARGYSKVKVGTVAEVVPRGQRPNRDRFSTLYKHAGCGFSRDHESYVVQTHDGGTYWPRVKHLQLAQS